VLKIVLYTVTKDSSSASVYEPPRRPADLINSLQEEVNG